MPVNVMATLRRAVQDLEAEKGRIDRQLAAIRDLVSNPDIAKGQGVRAGGRTRAQPRRPRMTPAARRAVSRRMKAYWAKRRAGAAKSKGAPRTK